jgi:hypothetical protein
MYPVGNDEEAAVKEPAIVVKVCEVELAVAAKEVGASQTKVVFPDEDATLLQPPPVAVTLK